MTAVRRIIGIPLTLLIALVLQVAVVNRAPLPGDAGPDLMLLTVTALGAMLGPMTGLVAGFCGGLALDVAPPAGHLAGEYALVFCLAGYACGRIRNLVDPMEEHVTVTSVTVMAVGAAGGEALKAALGLMLSDPDVTGPAVKHVLLGAILYDLLLSPFVLWLVALAVARPARPHVLDPHRRVPRTAAQYGAVRLATAGSAPKLHLGGGGPMTPVRPPIRREPKLRLAGSTSPALSRTGNGASPSSLSLGGRRPVSLNFSGTGGGLLGGGMPGGALGPSLFSGSPLRGASGLGKGWLRAGKPSAVTGPARGIAGTGPGKGWLRAGKPSAVTGPARGIAGTGPGKGWLRSSSGPGASALRVPPDWRRRQPGKRWLRPSKPAKAPHVNSPGKGWLRPPKPAKAVRRHSPGKGWLKAGKPASPGGRSGLVGRGSPGGRSGLVGRGSTAWRPRSPGRGWLNGSGVLGKPTTYQSRSAPLRRRRVPRIGGRR